MAPGQLSCSLMKTEDIYENVVVKISGPSNGEDQ